MMKKLVLFLSLGFMISVAVAGPRQSRANPTQPGSVPGVIVILGDSMSCQGYDSLGIHRWPEWMPEVSHAWTGYPLSNFAVSGVYTSFALDLYPAVHALRPTDATPGWLFCWTGINDVTAGLADAESIYGELKVLWRAARQDRFKVVAFTLTAYDQWTPAQFAVRDALNRRILSDPSLYDRVIRTDLILPDPSDPQLFEDGIHPTDEGSRRIAGLISLQWPF